MSDEALALTRRALAHYRQGTTDQAPSVMELPTVVYTDPARYQRERERIFRSLPLAACLSIELPQAGAYLALDLAGSPVLLARGTDGRARAFLNACRHRGARLCADGSGQTRVFSCPYHAWTYALEGDLIGRYGAATFGDVATETLGLVSLPCEESAGFVWVVPSPGEPIDVDAWLGAFKGQLEGLRLDEWRVYAQRAIPGPGWKVTMDGYLEAYHHNAVHGKTVGKHTIGNLMVHDSYGPHQRLTFGRKTLADLDETDVDRWDPHEHIRIIHSCFPNLSISGILGGFCLVSQVFPGECETETLTRQTVLIHAPHGEGPDEADARAFSEMTLQAVRDEDYPIGFAIQSTLKTQANEHFLLGRNELGLQHYHRWVERFMAQRDSYEALRDASASNLGS